MRQGNVPGGNEAGNTGQPMRVRGEAEMNSGMRPVAYPLCRNDMKFQEPPLYPVWIRWTAPRDRLLSLLGVAKSIKDLHFTRDRIAG